MFQSALDLLEAGYQPILVEDCISARRMHDKQIAMERARAEGMMVTTYEALLFELMRSAEHEKFRLISRLCGIKQEGRNTMLERFYPREWVASTYEIDFDKLYRKGYRGIIFDIDNTLVPHGAGRMRVPASCFPV